VKAGRPQDGRRRERPRAPAQGQTQGHSLAEGLALAARVIGDVLRGASLNAALAGIREDRVGLRAAAQDLSYKALRAYGRVNALADRLTEKPVADGALYGLLLAALAELMSRPATAYAVVHQAVEAASLLDRARARGLINAVLRRYLREGQALLDRITATDEGRYCHPQWWIERLKAHYPDRFEPVLEQANLHPPMTLRVNVRKNSVAACLERLGAAGINATPLGGEAIRLARPQRVESLPGFVEGEISVQDAGAQHAPRLLDVRDGMSVLDACAAPGGKAAHILERSSCELLAVDASPERVRRIDGTLARLGLKAEVKIGDSLRPESYTGGRMFERILLDAPCTASGVVRRHPDIKWLRRETDIASFAARQALLLDALWRVLAADGKLLYVTCSVFPEENRLQADTFLARHADAQALPVDGIPGGQILPQADTDGFFYALLYKRP
jgi:16S rRNA (cytosine967-C5)-methyltransferase